MLPATAIKHAEEERTRPYSPRQRKFLEVLAKNKFEDFKGCAAKAGVPVTAYPGLINGLREDIKRIATSLLLESAPKAAIAITDMLDNSAVPGAGIKLQAAKEVLDRVGVVNKEQVEHIHSGGIFIIPMKAELPPIEGTLE